MAKSSEAYRNWFTSLPWHSLVVGSPGSDERSEYFGWTRLLTQEAAAVAQGPVHPPSEFPEAVCRYGVVECGDGEVPRMKLFPTPEALATWIGLQEGRDVFVFPFYGAPLGLTSQRPRYLLLPDGAAVTVPVVPQYPAHRVTPDQFGELEVGDGFLGPPELAVEAAPRKSVKDDTHEQQDG